MPSLDPNPFESPLFADRREAGQRKRFWGWRLIPTVIFGLLGSCSLSLGCVLTISLGKWLAEGIQPRWWWYVSLVVFYWTGAAWVLASWLYLKKRPRWGTIAVAAGFAIPLGWEVLIRIWPLVL